MQVVWTVGPRLHEVSSMWREHNTSMDHLNSINGFPSMVVGTGITRYHR